MPGWAHILSRNERRKDSNKQSLVTYAYTHRVKTSAERTHIAVACDQRTHAVSITHCQPLLPAPLSLFLSSLPTSTTHAYLLSLTHLRTQTHTHTRTQHTHSTHARASAHAHAQNTSQHMHTHTLATRLQHHQSTPPAAAPLLPLLPPPRASLGPFISTHIHVILASTFLLPALLPCAFVDTC